MAEVLREKKQKVVHKGERTIKEEKKKTQENIVKGCPKQPMS